MVEQQTTPESVPTCVYCGCRLEFLYHSEDLCLTCGDALEALGKGRMIRVMAGRLKILLAECRAAAAQEREACRAQVLAVKVGAFNTTDPWNAALDRAAARIEARGQ